MSKIGQFFKKRKSSILSMLGSLMLLVLAGGVGAFVAFYTTYSPEKYMDEYYKCFINESYEALFSSADIEDSDFITLDGFTQMMVNDLGYEDNEKYSITDVKKSGKTAKATVSFTDSETDEKVSWDLVLEKGKERHYLFFRDWIVNLDEFVIDNVKLTASNEVEVVLDDINITSDSVGGVKKSEDPETGMVTYIVDHMFMGTHTLLFVGQNTEVESVLVNFDEDDKVYTCRDGVVKADIQGAISTKVVDIIVGMYNAAFEDAGTENIVTMFASDEEVAHNIYETYLRLMADINKDDGATLTSIDITDYSVSMDKYEFNGEIKARFYYTASYTAKEPRDIVDGVVIDGVRQNYEGTVDSEAYVTFELIDGTWQATSIDMKCIDYSLPEEE